MKLLLDQNLSHHLVPTLAVFFPGSLHVRDIGYEAASDETIWKYAKNNHLTIVSKDSDFLQQALLFGPPPKFIWLRCGNRSTAEIEIIIKRHIEDIREFHEVPRAATLILSE